MSVKPILFEKGVCRMLDQRLLPTEEVWIDSRIIPPCISAGVAITTA